MKTILSGGIEHAKWEDGLGEMVSWAGTMHTAYAGPKSLGKASVLGKSIFSSKRYLL